MHNAHVDLIYSNRYYKFWIKSWILTTNSIMPQKISWINLQLLHWFHQIGFSFVLSSVFLFSVFFSFFCIFWHFSLTLISVFVATMFTLSFLTWKPNFPLPIFIISLAHIVPFTSAQCARIGALSSPLTPRAWSASAGLFKMLKLWLYYISTRSPLECRKDIRYRIILLRNETESIKLKGFIELSRGGFGLVKFINTIQSITEI